MSRPAESPRGTIVARLALALLVAAVPAGPFLAVLGNDAAHRLADLLRGFAGDMLPSYIVNTAIDWGLAQAVLLLAGVVVFRRTAVRPATSRTSEAHDLPWEPLCDHDGELAMLHARPAPQLELTP
jgi:hypothetical protein